ncbi:MAG: MFS transporter [Gemmatimonadales bacterium]|nr:MFS transporter [Gemmatimonadales bacterium]MBP6571045.1 MFS transporter [Gemmatimonadales bacterium]
MARTDAPLPRRVRGLSLVSGLNDASSEMVYPLLPALIVTTLGGSATSLAALDGLADLTAALLRLPAGKLADRRERRPLLVLGGYGIAAAARALIAVASSVGMVIGLRMTDRVGKGLRSPGRDAMLAEAVPAAQRGRAFGFHRAFDHGGAVVGSLLGWALLQYAGLTPRAVIGWSVVPGVLAILMLWWTLRGREAPVVEARLAPPASKSAERAATAAFWPPILALTLLVVSRLPETLLLLHLQRHGVALALIPLAWAGLHVVRSASAYPAGWLVDRVGERGVVVLSGSLAALGAWALGEARTPVAMMAVFLAFGLVTGIGEPAEKSTVARLAPKGAGSAFGQAQAVTGVTSLAAALLFGMVVDAQGTAAALWLSAVAGVGATAAWWLVTRPANK